MLVIVECFGRVGIDFRNLCLWTFARRRQRQQEHLRDLEAGTPPVNRASRGGFRGTRYCYLPRPQACPIEIAGLVVEHCSALREA
jgi:hypothetical protein